MTTRPAKRSKTARQHDDGTTPTTTTTATTSNNNKLRNLLLALEAFDHNNKKDPLVLLEEDDNNAAKEIVDDICNGGIDQVENMRMKLQYIDGLLSDNLSTLKQKKKKEEEHKKESQTDDHPPLEVVRCVIHSGYLNSVDLGRFVLFSNKSFLKNLTPEFVYEKLCTIHWGFLWDDDENEMNRIITTTMGGSYQRALQSGFGRKPIVKSQQATPKPNWLGTWNVPKTILSSENIVLVASVWTNSSRIFKTQLSTREVKSLLESSSDDGYKMTIPSPIYKNMLNNLEKDWAKQTKGNTARTMNRENKKVPLPNSWPIMKIHCIRMDIHQIRIIYDSSLSLLHVDGMSPNYLNIGNYSLSGLSLDSETQFFSPSWPLTPTDLGHRLVGRWLNSKSSLVFKYSGLTFSSRNIMNGEFLIYAGATGAHKAFICPYDYYKPYNDNPPMERNNVTMYHLLQELQLWD